MVVLDSLKAGLVVHFKKAADKRFTMQKVWLDACEQYVCWGKVRIFVWGHFEPQCLDGSHLNSCAPMCPVHAFVHEDL